MGQLNQREIKSTKCDLNGNEAPLGVLHHYYIIISKNNYNQRCNNVLAIPLTSRVNYYTLNFGVDITNEDIDGTFALEKATFVLCDRPCRVKKSFLKAARFDGARINDVLFDKILRSISFFMKYGKCKMKK